MIVASGVHTRRGVIEEGEFDGQIPRQHGQREIRITLEDPQRTGFPRHIPTFGLWDRLCFESAMNVRARRSLQSESRVEVGPAVIIGLDQTQNVFRSADVVATRALDSGNYHSRTRQTPRERGGQELDGFRRLLVKYSTANTQGAHIKHSPYGRRNIEATHFTPGRPTVNGSPGGEEGDIAPGGDVRCDLTAAERKSWQ